MAWFIRVSKRITWIKCLVEAPGSDDPDDIDAEEYLGYVDLDTSVECPDCPGLATEIHGPFATKDDAFASDEAWTEGP